MSLINPYSFIQTTEKLALILNFDNAAKALFEKAVEKASNDREYAYLLNDTLLKGSTVELRAAFSVFGNYLDCKRQECEPFYLHRHAVDYIDTSMYYLKMGFIDNQGKRCTVPDLADYTSLEICAAITLRCNNGTEQSEPLFGVASGQLSLADLVNEDCSKVFFTVYARDEEGFAKAIHNSDTLEQAYAVSRFIKGCNSHLLIEAN